MKKVMTQDVTLEEQMVRYEIGVALPEEIRGNEIPLTVDSPLRSLRVACAFYQIGQSGGKRKCLQSPCGSPGSFGVDVGTRSCNTRISDEPEDSSGTGVNKVPTEAERKTHELTHVPYAPLVFLLHQASSQT